jgi:hypothetical protein
MSAAAPFTALPLFTVPATPMGWHQVQAPGGYETWRFDAEDASGDVRFTAELVEGCCWHRGYQAAYRAFGRRPTRRRPPLPADWPCVHVAIRRRSQPPQRFVWTAEAKDFLASASSAAVSIGACKATPLPDGPIRLVLCSPPSKSGATPFSASFDFLPIHPPSPPLRSPLFARPHRPLATPTRWGGEHWWLTPAPLCEVRGTLQLAGDANPASAQTLQFAGRGMHDRTFGTAPPGLELKRTMRGRVLLADRTIAFQLAIPTRTQRTIAHLLEFDASAAAPSPIRAARAAVQWDGRTTTQMRFPTRLGFAEQAIELANPTAMEIEPHALHLLYEVTLGGKPIAARAECEVTYPRRLRWTSVNRLMPG